MSRRKLAAAGAAALVMALVAGAPAHAKLASNGFMLNGFALNGFVMNGLKFNGPDQPVVVPIASGGGGFSFNAVKLYDVVPPDGAR